MSPLFNSTIEEWAWRTAFSQENPPMPKVAIRTEDRIRIELEYDDYKEWERILGDNALESTTLVDPNDPNSGWWKTLYIKIGETEYRFSGPIMRSREE